MRKIDSAWHVDFTADSGLRFDARISQMMMGCVVADYDCDGCLDYYILYQSHRAVPTDVNIGYLNDDVSGIENQLWRTDGKGHFVNVTSDAGVDARLRNSFAARDNRRMTVAVQ